MATAEIIKDQITDESIYKAAYGEWVGVLASMWDAIGKDVDDRRLKVYAEQFKNIPYGLLEKAVARAIRNNGNYLTVPSVSALWDAIKREAGDSMNIDFRNRDALEAVETWVEHEEAKLDAATYRFAGQS